jgi:hypothetical protein
VRSGQGQSVPDLSATLCGGLTFRLCVLGVLRGKFFNNLYVGKDKKTVQKPLKTCSFLLIFAQDARISVNFLCIFAHFYPHFSLKNQYVL